MSDSKNNKWKASTLQEIFGRKFEKRHHLLYPWMREGESCMVYAAPGVGKSLFALDVALSVAGGGKCLGLWEVGKPREGHEWKVLYVDGEMPIEDIQDRAFMLANGKRKKDDDFDMDKVGRNLTFLSRQDQNDVTEDFVDLASSKSRQKLFAMIEEGEYNLVILDNLSTLALVEDENSASSFNGTIQFLQMLKAKRIACLLVHHTNKGKESFRGSTKIATTFETMILLTKQEVPISFDDENDNCFASSFSLTWHKYRGKRNKSINDETKLTLYSFGEYDDSDDYYGYWEVSTIENDKAQDFVNLVKSGNYTSQDEIASIMGISKSYASKIRGKAINRGLITEDEVKKYLSKNKKNSDF